MGRGATACLLRFIHVPIGSFSGDFLLFHGQNERLLQVFARGYLFLSLQARPGFVDGAGTWTCCLARRHGAAGSDGRMSGLREGVESVRARFGVVLFYGFQ